jgi:uncharacterized protein YndB with AHSA1/START domain
MESGKKLKVEALIEAPLAEVWKKWTEATHVVNWNFAHESWHCPHAEVDFQVGGTSTYRMEAKDGSFGFDLNARFLAIQDQRFIQSELEDGRAVEVYFEEAGAACKLVQYFEPETENPLELQQGGWQAILNHFKQYCEQ